VNKRNADSNRILNLATIEFGDKAIGCSVRDLSTIGAILELKSRAAIPERFTLLLWRNEMRKPCRMVWWDRRQIGVAFD